MRESARHKIDNFFDVCQRNIDTLSPEKVREKQSRYLDEEKKNYFALKLEKFLSNNPDFSKRFKNENEENSEPVENCIYFSKLRNHIIGAYGKFELLKSYYDKNGWKFKVSDLLTLEGVNLGPGCIFSLKQSPLLLSMMKRDGWDITEVAALVSKMKAFVKERNESKREEKRKEKKETPQRRTPIKFHYLSNDQFVIYGDETKIKETLGKLNCEKNKKSLASIGVEEHDYAEGFIVSYSILLPFIDSLGDDWDVKNVREWALTYSLEMLNTEEEASKKIKTTHDIDNFFDWCYQNQKIIYAGTFHQKYLSLKESGRLQYFLSKLSKFFVNARDVNPECRKWFMNYVPRLGKVHSYTVGGNVPRAKIIYIPMGGLNKRR